MNPDICNRGCGHKSQAQYAQHAEPNHLRAMLIEVCVATHGTSEFSKLSLPVRNWWSQRAAHELARHQSQLIASAKAKLTVAEWEALKLEMSK